MAAGDFFEDVKHGRDPRLLTYMGCYWIKSLYIQAFIYPLYIYVRLNSTIRLWTDQHGRKMTHVETSGAPESREVRASSPGRTAGSTTANGGTGSATAGGGAWRVS